MATTQKLRKLRNQAINKQNNRCIWCNCKMHAACKHTQHSATLEHIIPKEWGGTNEPNNIAAACASCNHSHQNYRGFGFLFAWWLLHYQPKQILIYYNRSR